jgi:L-lactate dehydrogenase complex protein LldE
MHALEGHTVRVALFVTCLVDLMRPRIGFAAISLLEAAGCEVVVPRSQTCCGQPAYNSGDRQSARAFARKFLDEFSAFDYVVIPSGSCAGMVKTHYADLLADDSEALERFRQFESRVYELTDFLGNVARPDSLPGTGYSGRLTYHDSCSGLRELGIKSQPRELLAGLPGVQLAEMVDATTCCGFGGTFSLKFGEISTAMVERKCNNVAATGADAVVAGDLGCLLNIEGRLRRRGDRRTRVFHIAEVLAGMTEDK